MVQTLYIFLLCDIMKSIAFYKENILLNGIKNGSNMGNNNLKHLGNRIKEIRRALGLSQKDFAAQLGINPGYLSELENGNRENPTLAVFMKISTQFHASIDYIVHGTGNMFLPSKSNNGREYIKDVRSLDDVYWLIDNSLLFRDAIMSMAARIFYENENFINENIKRSRDQKED